MSGLARLNRAAAYVPVIGWLYVYVFQRENAPAMYHLRQSVGLALFLIGSLAGWAVVAWVLAWIPYMGVLGVALFSLVIAAYLFGAVAWIIGLINALTGRVAPLPGIGRRFERLFGSRL